MTINLLIVDDEELTRECLANYINWRELDITETKTASNGIQALETAKDFVPDILITDIKMPHMSGIELSHKFKEKYPSCKIIFISGYAEKEYLKSAIDLKVEAYIDKPVTSDNVVQTAEKVVRLIKKEREKQHQEFILGRNLNRAQNIVRQEIAQALIRQDLDWNKFRLDFIPTYFRWENEHPYLAVCMKLHSSLEHSFAKTLCSQLEQFIKNNYLMDCKDYYIGLIEDERPFFITDICSLLLLNQLFEKIKEKLFTDFRLNCTIVIGPTVNSISQIPDSYRTAYHALDYYSLYSNERTLINCHFEIVQKTAPEEIFRLKNYTHEEITYLFNILQTEQYTNIEYIRRRLFDLYHNILQNSTVQSGITWEAFKEYSLADYEELLKSDKVSLNFIHGYNEYDIKIKQALQYIQSNYSNKDLSLKMVADAIELSQNYFCTLFKQNTGLTVNEFIIKIRIERAKYLLRSTNLKLYEIGEKIGIPDANYLNILFKKNCLITPTQYRKKA